MLKGLTSFIAAALLAVPCLLQAVQVDELHLPMTRTEADNTLSKDYDFTILEDTTVRRQWHANGRRICMDFDITTDQAICIRITYDKPVSRAKAEEDVEKLCGKTGSKWTKTKKKAVARVGISEKSLLKTFDNGAVLFLEGSNKKFTRITYFAKPPKEDRWQLQPMSNGGHVTAMGSTSRHGAGAADALIADERRRQSTAPTVASVPTTPKQESSSSSTPKSDKGKSSKGNKGNKTASTPKQEKPATPVTPAKPEPATPAPTPKPKPAPVVAQTGSNDFSSGQVVETIEEIGFIEASGILDFSYFPDFADAWAESEGLEEKFALIKDRVPTSQLIAAIILIFLLLMLIWSIFAKIRSKARAKANYKKIVANGPQNGGAAPKLTPTKVTPKPAPAEAPAPVPTPAEAPAPVEDLPPTPAEAPAEAPAAAEEVPPAPPTEDVPPTPPQE